MSKAAERRRKRAIEEAWRERERLRQQENRTRRREIREEEATTLDMKTRAALSGTDIPTKPHLYEARRERKARESSFNRAIENRVDYLSTRAPASERKRPEPATTTRSIVQTGPKSKTPALDFLYQSLRDNKPIDTNTIRLAVEQARQNDVTIPIGLQQAYDDVTKFDRAAALSEDALAREETVKAWQERRAEQAGILGVPVVGNAIKEGRDIVKGLPKAALGIYQAISENTKEGGGIPEVLARTTYDALVEPQYQYYKGKYYEPISRGDWSGLMKNLEETPISTALDLTGAYSLLKSGANRASAAGRTLGEGGTISDAYRAGKAPPPPRILRSGDLEVRVPSSPSPSGRLMQETYDNLRRALAPGREQARVARAGARDMRIEHGRTMASFAQDTDRVKALDSLGMDVKSALGVASKPAAMATVVDATLPPAARGGAGLKAYAARMRELADEATDPRTRADLIAQASRLDRAAAAAGKVDPETIAAIERLQQMRQDTLIAAGKLNPTTAMLRQNLMGERLGLLDPRVAEVTAKIRGLLASADDPVAVLNSPEVLQLTDELAALNAEVGAGTYVGEVATKAPKTLKLGGKTRPGTGKTREVRGVGKQNTGALFEQGRVRLDPNRVLEDFQDIWRYEYANRVKADLAKLGEPIGPEGPRPGYVVINPDGHKIPRKWRDAPRERQWDAEGMTKAQVESDLVEYSKNIAHVTDKAGANPVVEAAIKAGQDLSTLRQVPAEVASRYFQEYTGKPGVFFGSAGKMAKGYDIASDIVRTSVIYANPGYIPANLVSNLGMLTADAVFWAPKDLISAANMIYRKGDRVKDLVPLIRAEIQQGPSRALIQGDNIIGSGLKKFIGATTDIPDALPRTAAWIHHAKKIGFKTPERMRALLTDPKYRDQLNHVREQVNNAMGDFERVTSPAEKAWVQRILFVYPWLKASARWPFTFARDYPAKAAFVAHASLEAERDPKYDLPVEAPSYLSELIGMGGITDGQFLGVNPRSVTWLNTIPGLADTTSRAVKGEGNTSFLDIVRPELRALSNIVSGTSQFGERVGAAEAAKQAGLGLVPLANTVNEFINPRGELPGYVGDKDRNRLGVVKLRVLRGMVPVWYDAQSVSEAADRETTGPLPLAKVQEKEVQKFRDEYRQEPDEEITKLIGLDVELDRMRREARKHYQDEVKKRTGRRPSDLSDTENAHIDLQATAELVIRELPGEDADQVHQEVADAAGDLEYTRDLLKMYRELLGLTYLSEYKRDLGKFSEERTLGATASG